MADPNQVLAEARNLLRDDQVQKADDLISDYFKTEASAGHPVKGTEEAAPTPREPQVVLNDLLTEMVGLFGNKQSLLDKLAELAAVS